MVLDVVLDVDLPKPLYDNKIIFMYYPIECNGYKRVVTSNTRDETSRNMGRNLRGTKPPWYETSRYLTTNASKIIRHITTKLYYSLGAINILDLTRGHIL